MYLWFKDAAPKFWSNTARSMSGMAMCDTFLMRTVCLRWREERWAGTLTTPRTMASGLWRFATDCGTFRKRIKVKIRIKPCWSKSQFYERENED